MVEYPQLAPAVAPATPTQPTPPPPPPQIKLWSTLTQLLQF